jgi:hypothetical protein
MSVPLHEELLREAAQRIKRDSKGAIALLHEALERVTAAGDQTRAAQVADELARAWGRRRSPAKQVHYARMSVRLAPERSASWATMAKTCELLATQTPAAHRARAKALFRLASGAFTRASECTRDPEDRRWLQELAKDAAQQARRG